MNVNVDVGMQIPRVDSMYSSAPSFPSRGTAGTLGDVEMPLQMPEKPLRLYREIAFPLSQKALYNKEILEI
jgi:hypothetical protein